MIRLLQILVAACLSLVAIGSPAVGAEARVLRVGPGQFYDRPSAVLKSVLPGDTISIEPGEYVDCAVWPADAGKITITAAGEGDVILRDKTCENKAIFVIKGADVTVRGITFIGAKAPQSNGAGIRAEGRNLTIEKSRFIDNDEGILAGSLANSTMVLRDSLFQRNGNCDSVAGCSHGVYVGQITKLVVEGCTFLEQHIGHHIKSRAARTELIDNIIEDGVNGTASYLVDIPNGGSLLMRGNTLEKGPKSDNPTVAVILGEEGNKNQTPEITIEDNRFINDLGHKTLFVRNLTGTEAALRGNTIFGSVQPLDELRR